MLGVIVIPVKAESSLSAASATRSIGSSTARAWAVSDQVHQSYELQSLWCHSWIVVVYALTVILFEAESSFPVHSAIKAVSSSTAQEWAVSDQVHQSYELKSV